MGFGPIGPVFCGSSRAQTELSLMLPLSPVPPCVPVQDVNLFGYVWLALHALPYLRRTQGRILVNASCDAFTPVPRHSVYSVSPPAHAPPLKLRCHTVLYSTVV